MGGRRRAFNEFFPSISPRDINPWRRGHYFFLFSLRGKPADIKTTDVEQLLTDCFVRTKNHTIKITLMEYLNMCLDISYFNIYVHIDCYVLKWKIYIYMHTHSNFCLTLNHVSTVIYISLLPISQSILFFLSLSLWPLFEILSLLSSLFCLFLSRTPFLSLSLAI